MDKSVKFEKVVKLFGQFEALSGLDFSIEKGELYGLIGPNGAGKTTAIRLLLGLQKVTSGKITVLGQSPGAKVLYSEIGYMPQETALYFELTARENLELFGRLYGIPNKKLIRKITELLEFVGLEDWGEKIVANLSGGMKHRVSLAVALLAEPKLLVLDEPTVGVDPELRQHFWSRFAKMQKNGTTILITTHYMDEASRCHRVGLISHGQMIAEDTPDNLLNLTKQKSLEDAFLKLIEKKR